MQYCFRFPTKNDFLGLFFWIWVETHFPLKHPFIYLCQVAIQFKSREVLLSWIIENKDVSSGNNLAFEDNPFDKSLIHIKNYNGPSIDP